MDVYKGVMGTRTYLHHTSFVCLTFADRRDIPGIYGINSAAAHEDHRRYRALFAPAFSERALKSQEPLFRSHVDLLVSKLSEAVEGGQPVVDMAKLFQLTTFDIMGELTFGKSLGQLDTTTYSHWVRSVFDSIRAIPIAQLIQYYPLLQAIFDLVEPQSIRDMKYNHFRFSADRVDRRLERGSDKPDIWNLVLSAQDDKKLSLEEMYCHADVFMLAGSETSVPVDVALTYSRLCIQDNHAPRTHEARSRFQKEEAITMESTAPLKYLNACKNLNLVTHPILLYLSTIKRAPPLNTPHHCDDPGPPQVKPK